MAHSLYSNLDVLVLSAIGCKDTTSVMAPVSPFQTRGASLLFLTDRANVLPRGLQISQVLIISDSTAILQGELVLVVPHSARSKRRTELPMVRYILEICGWPKIFTYCMDSILVGFFR